MPLLANYTGIAGTLSTAYASDSGHSLVKSPGAANSSHPQLNGTGALVAQETNATHLYHWSWAPAGPNYRSGNWFTLPDMRGGTGIGSTARQQAGANTAYVAWWFNNFGSPYFEIYKVVAGVVTSLATIAGDLAVGDSYQPICEPHAGGVLFFVQRASDGKWWDGDTWEAVAAPVLTSNDTSIAVAGFAGLIFSTGSSLGTVLVDQSVAADPVVVSGDLSGTITLESPSATGGMESIPPSTLSGTSDLGGPTVSGGLSVPLPTLTVPAIKNPSNIVLPAEPIPVVSVSQLGGAPVLQLADLVTNGSGDLVIPNAAFVRGTTYVVAYWNADCSKRWLVPVQAV